MAIQLPPNADADGYATVVEASAYFVGHTEAAEWDAATEASKEAALRSATRDLDPLPWRGSPTHPVADNALRWPRTGVVNRDGQSLPSDTIPRQLKMATYEQALFLLKKAASNSAGQTPTEIEVGPVALKFGGGGGALSTAQVTSVAYSLLGDLLAAGGSMASLVRA